MTFAHLGLAVAGLAAVSIPIIIHLLFRRRRRPVPWAAMRFLLEALRRQRRRLRLEQLLLLLTRCALVALLALAIGRPILEKAGLLGSSGRDVYILLDDSIASAARSPDGTVALDRLKAAAADMLASLGPGDRAGLITLATPPDTAVVPASADITEVGRLIQELRPAASRADIGAGLERLADRRSKDEGADANERETIAVVLSDFRTGSADVGRALPENLQGLQGVRVIASEPAQGGIGNVQVVSVEPVRGIVVTGEGEGSERIDARVRLRRTGPSVGEPAATTVRVRAESLADSASAGATGVGGETVVRWEAGQSEATTVVGIEVVRAASWGDEIVLRADIDRDALETDNTSSRVVALRERLAVGIVGAERTGKRSGAGGLDPEDWVRLALAPTDQSTVLIESIEPTRIDPPVVARLDAVFVVSPELVSAAGWTALASFADRGGLLVVTPPENATTHVWADAMTQALGLELRMAREATSYPDPGIGLAPDTSGMLGVVGTEFERLARPVHVQKSVRFESLAEGARPVLSLEDGTPWIVTVARTARSAEGSESSVGRGSVVIFGSALSVDWTDLPTRPLMVPLMQELVREGVGRASASGTVVAGIPAALGAGVDSADLRDGTSILRGAPGSPIGLSRTPGVARLRDEAGRGLGLLAINPDVDGARTDVVDEGAVRNWLGANTSGAPSPDSAGAPLETVEWLTLDNPAGFLAHAERGAPISLPLLIAALAVAIAELAMARWFSHAIVGTGAGSSRIGPAEGAAAA